MGNNQKKANNRVYIMKLAQEKIYQYIAKVVNNHYYHNAQQRKILSSHKQSSWNTLKNCLQLTSAYYSRQKCTKSLEHILRTVPIHKSSKYLSNNL